jgi:Vacuolar sorting protein 9 (VPS9) domain
MIYKEKLHPYMAEIAIHVQSFLGCDEQAFNHAATRPLPEIVGGANLCDDAIGLSQSLADVDTTDCDDVAPMERTRLQLKRGIQRYTYRLFLLDPLRRIVDNFVDTIRLRGPRRQDIENLEAQGRDALKAKAMQDLSQIQTFLDKIQDLIIDGCMDDFNAIAQHPEYEAIYGLLHGSQRRMGYWDSIVREAIREQVEIEVYVPLRSVVSRWLVNGWRHEDMEVHFRMKELGRRSQEFFRIAKGSKRYDWSSVSQILYRGVGLSTLPCVKLRAIVDAAREIFRIFSEDQQTSESIASDVQVSVVNSSGHLGADDFLPIFIYCVVQAEMERPCALCALLRTLCDRTNKIGEVGYYLMSFEAVIKHCEEVDLSEDREEMPSFLTIPLDDGIPSGVSTDMLNARMG